jgi:hypothetical protein
MFQSDIFFSNRVNYDGTVIYINGCGSNDTPKRFAENMTVYQNVFHELTESMIEVYYYSRTTYYNIIENYGNTKLLVFILRVYKIFVINKIQYSIKDSYLCR